MAASPKMAGLLVDTVAALATILFVAGCASQNGSEADARAMLASMHQDLDHLGHWEDVGDAGRCFVPKTDDSTWRPYAQGQWIDTDAGLAFDSEEPWADTTYHYGHWFQRGEGQWVWQPGMVWSPAWVAWCTDGDYYGWAPMPPGGVCYDQQHTRKFVCVRRKMVRQREKCLQVRDSSC